jgi:hypothetical protein
MRLLGAFAVSLGFLVVAACTDEGAADGDDDGASGNAGDGSGGTAPSGGSAGSAGSGANAGNGAGGSSGGSTQGGGGSSAGANGGTTNQGGAGSGSGGSATAGSSTGGTSGDRRLPEANAPFDYQIGGDYPPPSGVMVVSRDRESSPAPNLYNICYVNGFQAQPSEESFWLDDHPELVLRDSAGDPVIDADWDEMLLDTSTPEKRDALAEIVGGWITGCSADGFDAVEIDNLDSYGRSEDLLTQDDNVAFMRLLSNGAHAQGLAIAQKNSTELLDRVPDMQTDFAVAEECNRWDECEDYRGAYGDRVFIIEYRQQDFDQGCSDYPGLSIVLRDLDVSTPSSGSYVYDGC